jgi:hypothetical protein
LKRGTRRGGYRPRPASSWSPSPPGELGHLAERPDCFHVKYSVRPRDGMYLGRCFLMDEHEVGMVWARYKEHPQLFCSIQDDDFTSRFRESV